MNPTQKHTHIIELLACTLKIFTFMFLLPMSYSISSGTCSIPALSKSTISVFLQNKAIQCVPRSAYSSRLIT